MVRVSEALALLTIYHFIFFYELYTKPFTMATSEFLSTFYPSWRWQGSQWLKGKVPRYEPHYWLNAHAHPVLSTYYPISILSSSVGNLCGLDTSFVVLLFTTLLHYLFMSIGWFLVLKLFFAPVVALFGAITFTYQTYHIKQQPCFVYTVSWFPWVILNPLAIGMCVMGGYLPVALYVLPALILVAVCLSFNWATYILIAGGLLISLVQVIPFVRYLPKTVRAHSQEAVDPGPWEKNFYIGLVPIILLILHPQWMYLWLGVPIVGGYLLRNRLPRVYQRVWILSAYAAIIFALPFITQKMALLFCVLQAMDLWLHRPMPTRPYAELPNRPSFAFNTSLTRFLEKNLGNERVDGLPHPLFTGLINGFNTVGYKGGMRLNLMEKYGHPRQRVKFTFSRKKLNLGSTSQRFLHRGGVA